MQDSPKEGKNTACGYAAGRTLYCNWSVITVPFSCLRKQPQRPKV